MAKNSVSYWCLWNTEHFFFSTFILEISRNTLTSLFALLLVLAIIPSVLGASITYNVQRFRKVKFENLLKNANGLYDIVSRTERKFVSITLFNVCVYCNRSQKTSQPVKNNKYETRRSRVVCLLSFTRCDVFCDLLQYTHKEKRYLFVLYNKTSKGLLKDSTSLLTWSDVDLTPSVSFNRSRSTTNENAHRSHIIVYK